MLSDKCDKNEIIISSLSHNILSKNIGKTPFFRAFVNVNFKSYSIENC